MPSSANSIPFAQAFRFWVRLGFINFGGPTGQIALMHAELVEKRKWIDEGRFLHALNYCMLLPGPEAQQLAIYTGWLLHGTWGGVVAGAFFVIPSMFLLFGLSWAYAAYGALPWVGAIFAGLQPAVIAIVALAMFRIGKKALRGALALAIAALAFVGLYFLAWPFPAIVLGAGVLGFLAGKIRPSRETSVETSPPPASARPSLSRSLRITAICVALWALPLLSILFCFGGESVFLQEGLFFSKAAMITFGGAYAVLPYVSQAAVTQFGWLQPGQMLAGLGLAETTPGPLIMVLQFVGFMGGWNHPGNLEPWLAGLIGSLITTWVTFVPCFLWIFLGAPYIEALRGLHTLNAALSAITAAVVGVILNLAIWFAFHAICPSGQPVNWFAAAMTLVALAGMLKWKWGVIPVVLGSGMLGLLRYWAVA